MKKIVSLVLALLMALSCLSFASAEEPVEIRYLFGLGGNLGDLFLRLVDEYNASQTAVHVTPMQVASYGTSEQSYQANLAAGDPIEVWSCTNDEIVSFGAYFQPLNEYYEDPEFDQDDLLSGAKEGCYMDDRETIISVPLWCTIQLMYYRKDCFEGYDIDEVFSNWQNLAEACKEIVESGKAEYGWEPMAGGVNIVDIMMNTGTTYNGYYADPEFRTVNYLTDEWIDVMSSLRTWLHEDKIMTTHWGGTGWEYWYATIDDVMDGTAAGYTGSAGDGGDINWDLCYVCKQPGWGDHETCVQTDAHLVSMSSLASDAEKAAAWDFMKFLSTPYCQAKISMTSGYPATHASVLSDPTYAAYVEENPQAAVVLDALNYTTIQHIDITGGYIDTAMGDMVQNVQLEGMDPVEALTICQEEAQAALDEYWADQE